MQESLDAPAQGFPAASRWQGKTKTTRPTGPLRSHRVQPPRPTTERNDDMKTSQHRTVRTTRLLGTAAFAALLAAAAAPSFAGNYAEGDPRPASFSSSTTREAVTAEARQWLKTAPTQGYTDGTPQQQVATVSANSRAAVAADTRLWMQSGLAAKQSGEAG
eukprot:gene31417-35462_t